MGERDFSYCMLLKRFYLKKKTRKQTDKQTDRAFQKERKKEMEPTHLHTIPSVVVGACMGGA